MIKAIKFCLVLIFICKTQFSLAQISPPPSSDSLRTINIIYSRVYREKAIDSVTKLEILAGGVSLIESGTKFTCDSAVINKRLNSFEAFGNVHINQGDSVFTSSQYLKYLGSTRVAYLKKNVKLTDRKATLFTQDLEYDLSTGTGKYHKGGKVVNGKTTLTSTEGIYHEDTKDVYFINKVNVVDAKNTIKADSLLYNMQTQKLNFIGPTHIKNKDGNIFTTQGTYDLNTGNAFFTNRTLIKDSSGRTYQANNMALDDKTGEAQLAGNAIIKDSANKFIVTGNEIFISKKNNSFLATKKPVMIYWEKKDTTYISGDTLFSGFTKRVYAEDIIPVNDSIKAKIAIKDYVAKTIVKKDSSKLQIIRKPKNISANKADTLIRYFIAYHHVKIFNDSLQSVSDSLFYSGADSVIRLFYDPVIWSGNSQLNGDTMYLFTKNKKPERVFVFDNGMMINKINPDVYNQIGGKTINTYFKNGVIDFLRVKGSPAESIYYLQDKDSAFTGMNRADGSVIDMFFVKQQFDKVKFLNDVHGILYPMRKIPPDKKYLKNFDWKDKRRPKNKLELFE